MFITYFITLKKEEISMENIFNTGDSSIFSWEAVDNVAEGRKNLGEKMPVLIYRVALYSLRSVLMQRLGDESMREIFREAGSVAGKEFARHLLDLSLPLDEFLAVLQKLLAEQEIGILRVEKFDVQTGEAVLTVGEDLDCSGLPVTGDTVCNYDEGFLAGILGEYTGKNYIVTEVDCWASGARVCRFEAKLGE